MSEFKRGDKVRFNTKGFFAGPGRDRGTGLVKGRSTHSTRTVLVDVDSDGEWPYEPSELTLVEPDREFKKGDRVRVTVEGEVRRGFNGGGFEVYTNDFDLTVYTPGKVAIEGIEPPPEAFGPGDFVRSKAVPDYTYLVLKDGYVDLYNSVYNSHNTSEFNSLHYERVTLVEPPL